jgi:hypothetical protein
MSYLFSNTISMLLIQPRPSTRSARARQAEIIEYLLEIGFECSLELPVDGHRELNADLEV